MERYFLVLHRKRAHAIEPASEDLEFCLEEDPPGQQSFPVPGASSGKLPHRKKSSLSQSARKKGKRVVEESAEAVMGDNSYIIKVENGNTTIQYVIQNPEGDHSTPSDSVVQDIANLLLAAGQSIPDGVVVTSASDRSLLATAGPQTIIVEPGSIHELQGDLTIQGEEGLAAETRNVDPLQGQITPQRIIVQCGEHTSLHEIVPPSAVELQVESNSEGPALNQDCPQDLSFLTASLLAGETDSITVPQRMLVAGGTILQNFTVSSETALSGHVISSSGDVHGHLSSMIDTGCTVENNEDTAVFVTLESIPTATVGQHVAMQTAPLGDQLVAMETDTQHMAVDSVPAGVVLDATNVFGPPGFDQQFVVKATSIGEGGDIILSGNIEQEQQLLNDC